MEYDKYKLKQFYNDLGDKKADWYIQMSDRKLEWGKDETLPSWENLHNKHSFIFEAGIFIKPDRFISIRQYNNGFLVMDGKLGDYENSLYSFYSKPKDCPTSKIYLFWEKQKCDGFNEYVPSFSVFGGFDGGQNEQ